MHRCPLPADPPALGPTTRTTPDRGTGAHPSGIGRTVTPRRQNHAPTPTEAHPDDHRRPDERSGLDSQNDRARGIWIPQAGFGQVTVRAHIQAMTLADVPSGNVAFGYRCPMRFSASSRIQAP